MAAKIKNTITKTKKTKRIKGCGSATCTSCKGLKGEGPWCPRCGASRYSTHKNMSPDIAWTPSVCKKCKLEMKASGKQTF